MCVCVNVRTCSMMHMWKLGDQLTNPKVSVFSFCRVGPGDPSSRPAWQQMHSPAEPALQPVCTFLYQVRSHLSYPGQRASVWEVFFTEISLKESSTLGHLRLWKASHYFNAHGRVYCAGLLQLRSLGFTFFTDLTRDFLCWMQGVAL